MARGKFEEWLSDDGLLRIEGWARDGLTDEQIAHNAGIGYTTLKTWLNRFPAIRAALKRGKAPADVEVENALYKSAIGYTLKVRKPIKLLEVKQKQGEGRVEKEYVEYVEEEVYVQPNTTAQIFWLKNRKPRYWRDIKAIDVEKLQAEVKSTAEVTVQPAKVDLSKLSDEELAQYESACEAIRSKGAYEDGQDITKG